MSIFVVILGDDDRRRRTLLDLLLLLLLPLSTSAGTVAARLVSLAGVEIIEEKAAPVAVPACQVGVAQPGHVTDEVPPSVRWWLRRLHRHDGMTREVRRCAA